MDSPISSKSHPRQKFFFICVLLLALMIALRLLTLGTAPLFDPTDSRYANIAQQMILRQDWITPYIPAFHQPFLGKPPLAFWLTATSYLALGCSELAARLPNFLEGLLTLLFTFLIARKLFDKRTAYLSPLILCSSLMFFIESGSVGMDMGVCLMVTASLWAYLSILKSKAQQQSLLQARYEILLGLFLGFGLLNKGPISLVLFLGPLCLYALIKKAPRLLAVPRWLIVLPIALGVSLPWYLAIQKVNPDFFDYFFIHEHFLRYLKSDYGDRYGSGHHQIYGMAWIFLLAAFLPWSIFLAPVIQSFNIKRFLNFKNLPALTDSSTFLLAWVLFAPLFFTFAKSILITYILTSLPPLAIVCARFISLQMHQLKKHGDQCLTTGRFFLLNPKQNLWVIAIGITLAAISLMIYNALFLKSISPLIQIICLAILLWITVNLRSLATHRTADGFKSLVLLIAIGAVLSSAYWFGFLSDSLGQTKSMKGTLNILESRIPDYAYRKIYFWSEAAPYTWYFYSQAAKVNEITAIHSTQPYYFPEPQVLKTLDEGRPFLLIVTTPFVPKFKQKYPDYFSHNLIAHHGKYYVFNIEK